MTLLAIFANLSAPVSELDCCAFAGLNVTRLHLLSLVTLLLALAKWFFYFFPKFMKFM